MNPISKIVDIYQNRGIFYTVEAVVRHLESKYVHSPTYWRKRLRITSILQNIDHEVNEPYPDPLSIIYVSPSDINLSSPTKPYQKWLKSGVVEAGDWDKGLKDLSSDDLYKALQSHFNDDVEWENTEFFHRALREIRDGEIKWGCRNRGELVDRCRQIDHLYSSIDNNGYLSKSTLATEALSDPIDQSPYSSKETYLDRYDEVAIDIGRNGELLFVDGRHRLYIAKIAGIDEIPVRVVKRHIYWQKKRESMYTMDKEPTQIDDDHPDIVQKSK